MTSVTSGNKKPISFAVQCKFSKLFLSNFTPCRAAIELTPVEKIATPFTSIAEARRVAESLHPLFSSFEFEPVRVGA